MLHTLMYVVSKAYFTVVFPLKSLENTVHGGFFALILILMNDQGVF